MTDNSKGLDIAQRIVEAMGRTSEPRMTADGQIKPDEITAVIGEVPAHLRHLHNLLVELAEEAYEAELHSRRARERHSAVHSIFFDALEQHVPSGDHDGVKLFPDWQVVGYRSDDKPEVNLSGLIGAALMAKMMAN